MCEVKAKTQKCHVDSKTHEMWKNGGESREWLEIALTETLDKLGAAGKGQHKKLRASCHKDSKNLRSYFEYLDMILNQWIDIYN